MFHGEVPKIELVLSCKNIPTQTTVKVERLLLFSSCSLSVSVVTITITRQFSEELVLKEWISRGLYQLK